MAADVLIEICGYCRAEPGTVNTCTHNVIPFANGNEPAVIYRAIQGKIHCPTCQVIIGGYHHPGCIQELCPRCHKFLQLDCVCKVVWDRPA